jgi:hypothetical protein
MEVAIDKLQTKELLRQVVLELFQGQMPFVRDAVTNL